MTFQQALRVFVSGMIVKAILPSWAMKISSKLREIKLASEEVEVYSSMNFVDFGIILVILRNTCPR